jgi:hypothetical protein
VRVNTAFPAVRARHEALTKAALRDVLTDQQADVVVAGRPISPEWDARLASTLYTRNRNTAADVALKVAQRLGSDFDPDVMDEWLTRNAEIAAENINASTRDSLAIVEDKGVVFSSLLTAGVTRYARSMTTTAMNFGALDAARASGAPTKTWTGGGSRHGSMNGETVDLGGTFSNGMAHPGDPAGGAENNANCGCSLEVGG